MSGVISISMSGCLLVVSFDENCALGVGTSKSKHMSSVKKGLTRSLPWEVRSEAVSGSVLGSDGGGCNVVVS